MPTCKRRKKSQGSLLRFSCRVKVGGFRMVTAKQLVGSQFNGCRGESERGCVNFDTPSLNINLATAWRGR